MKIFVTGTRGIPDIPGGVEKHCQELYPRIAGKGHNVFLICRDSYTACRPDAWRGVRLGYCFAPRVKSLEAIVHTLLSLIKALKHRPDIVHVHAIGPSLLIPVARLMGFKVVMTHHGHDYDRQKWGKAAKFALKLGERLGAVYADEVIVISRPIAEVLKKLTGRETNLIYNGVTLPERNSARTFLDKMGLLPGKYILAVARFVPEKGLHDLIAAFRQTDNSSRLAIAGDADHKTEYSRDLRKIAAQDERIVLTGYITGDPLEQLYSNAKLFVLPSYHEGLPIVLLEAMSYGLPVLASDIPANLEVKLPEDRYFRCGDVGDLAAKMLCLLEKGWTDEEKQSVYKKISENYDWEKISDQTVRVYRKVLGRVGSES